MTNICKYARFRAADAPSPRVPLGARSVGHHAVPAHWRDDTIEVRHVVCFWGIKGTGVMRLDGRALDIGPDCIGVYLPGQEVV